MYDDDDPVHYASSLRCPSLTHSLSRCNPTVLCERADLIDAVARMHVRRRAYEPAKALSDRFVALPDVKRYTLFASFRAME